MPEDQKLPNYRAYIDLLESHEGLAEAMIALHDRQGSAVTALRDSLATADPAEVDARLRGVISAAQRARRALKGSTPRR
jgi:hypothetical protein